MKTSVAAPLYSEYVQTNKYWLHEGPDDMLANIY